jgi:hypothetical protein
MGGSKIGKKETTWGKEVRRLIHRPGERIAAELHAIYGVEHRRAVVTRWLSGERQPDEETVKRINTVVGQLMGNESAREYLDAQARDDELLDTDNKTRARDALAAFDLIVGKVTPTLVRRVTEAIVPNRKLCAALHSAHRKALFDAVDGRVSLRTGLDVLRPILMKHSLDLDSLLDEDGSQWEAVRLEAEFLSAVRTALVRLYPDASARERFEAESAIKRAASAWMQNLPTFKAVAYQGPEFFGALVMASWRKRKLGVVPTRVARAYEAATLKRQGRHALSKFLRDYPAESSAQEDLPK